MILSFHDLLRRCSEFRDPLNLDPRNFRSFQVFGNGVKKSKALSRLCGTILIVLAVMGCSSPAANEPPTAWNNLNAGMTKEEISGLIGKPSTHLGLDQDVWRSSGWELQVGYDQNGRARDILRRPIGK
jgi:hypothetical protein